MTSVSTKGLTNDNANALLDQVNGVAEGGLKDGSRTAMREALELISDLTSPDTTLIFNDDGSVEIDESDDDDEDDEDDE